jgi:hypothetical protein
MIILPDKERRVGRVLLPLARKDWIAPSARRSIYGIADRTRWRVTARLHDGHVRWCGWFDDREDADAFVAALFTGSIVSEPALWDLPTPSWHPDVGRAIDILYAVTQTIALTTTGTYTLQRPYDWNNYSNSVQLIAGGGSGRGPGAADGGGGGAYSAASNIVLTGNPQYQVGAANTNSSAGDSYFNGTSLAAASVSAQHGTNGANASAGSQGGSAGAGIGTTRYSGGSGGQGYAYSGGGGGGGAGGPHGNGGSGAYAQSGGGGAGGGGASGGGNGSSLGGGSLGAGGANYLGQYLSPGAGGNGGNNSRDGVNGFAGIDIDGTSIGAGGGAGGGGGSGHRGGNGGLYGGGGGGAGDGNTVTSSGGQGVIYITYAPLVSVGLSIPMLGM